MKQKRMGRRKVRMLKIRSKKVVYEKKQKKGEEA